MKLNTLIITFFILLIAAFNILPHYSFLVGIILAGVLNLSSDLRALSNKYAKLILQISVVLLGAKLDLATIFTVGQKGLLLTFTSIVFIFFVGHLLSRALKVSSPISLLISSGTSICGGSAISAVAPVINAKAKDLATAMGVVFILNALAIFIFPPFAKFIGLSQTQFGTWAALAIHDTSSVVAASQLYGDEALKVGTTLKLLRSLWIIPLVLFIAFKNNSKNSFKFPKFIIGFVLLSFLFSSFSFVSPLISPITMVAKTGLSITLFLIGLNFGFDKISEVGVRPLLMGFSLWIITMISTLMLVLLTIS